MDNPKAQLADKLKAANNVLVTVSRNPSVDQLAACIGFTLLLNKLNKHAAAVFSGEVPSTLEFLKPEETIEKNTDSLRDFIIALDKSKADKLRYKVENNVVRIFITPYRTSITQDDLEFSQGDFNVDVVVALGVQNQADLDEAITTHGRILHDATVASVNVAGSSDLGSINWNDPQASSLSELVTELSEQLGKDLIDAQIATALLTGIVAETDRFSNQKTTSQTMSVSAVLMSAGANQQLVATKLNEPEQAKGPGPDDDQAGGQPAKLSGPPKPDDGSLDISHDELPPPADEQPLPDEQPPAGPPSPPAPEPQPLAPPPADHVTNGPKLITEPPTMGGALSANTRPESLDPVTDPLSLPAEDNKQLLDHSAPAAMLPASEPPTPEMPTPEPPAPVAPSVPVPEPMPPAPEPVPPTPELVPLVPAPAPEPPHPQTLSDLESSLGSVHQPLPEPPQAATEPPAAPPAEPLPELQTNGAPTPNMAFDPAKFGITSEPTAPEDIASVPNDPNAPPPVPPPIPFQFGNPTSTPQ